MSTAGRQPLKKAFVFWNRGLDNDANSESGPRRDGGGGASCTASPQAGAEGDGNIGTHARARAAGGEANQLPELAGKHARFRQDRKRASRMRKSIASEKPS